MIDRTKWPPLIVQPELVDEWGNIFYGKAHTTTGDSWWYEKDGRRYALRPAKIEAQKVRKI